MFDWSLSGLPGFELPEFTLLHAVTFIFVSSLVLLVYLLLPSPQGRLETRLQGLQAKEDLGSSKPMARVASSVLPRLGNPLIPKDEGERTKLQSRLVHAGMYGREALVFFLGVKMLLTLGPVVLGVLLSVSGLIPAGLGLALGAFFSVFGMILPSFWLDWKKSDRQTSFRRALPDALDVLVICLEGGLTLVSAIRRVSSELRLAHPGLAREMSIVQREVQLGRTTGDALRRFAERVDMEEIRSLAAVVNQAERFGASMVKVLRVHAESLRTRRLQVAEEMAQRAAIKILFPTLLLIFPGIFIVILGPAVIQLVAMFAKFR